MVKVEFYTDAAGRIYKFAAEGHSGFAPHGEDIVCAAVSVLLQTAVLGLQEVAGIKPQVVVGDGHLVCHLSAEETGNAAVHTILQTMLLGLQAIQAEYGGYVSVKQIDSARSAPKKRQ
ncbi:MAG: ribosomal-processing cysteine protease Prp [Firmicutes bacterium]|nr:ribosomal-processing cysteine protease Prp [Bacillota bacterium]